MRSRVRIPPCRGSKTIFNLFAHFYSQFDTFLVKIYHVKVKNATVVIKVELLHIPLNFLLLLQKCRISYFLTHFCAILTKEHIFCIYYNTIIRFRRESEFLPTFPMKYDHCVLDLTVSNLIVLRQK